jgi:Na+/melibiose symporter-like transporter
LTLSPNGAAAAAIAAPRELRRTELAAYGGLGLPLAFAALPLYVMVPDLYTRLFGLPLALVGGLLLAARLFDAVIDPLIGHWIDRGRRRANYGLALAAALPLLAVGFAGLFNPPAIATALPAAWLLAMLAVTCTGYSLATIAHQAWGAELARSSAGRARVAAAREGCGLVGVIAAALLPAALGMPATSALLAALLVAGGLLLTALPSVPRAVPAAAAPRLLAPLRNPALRALLGIFVVNGIASAVPATLVLFFVRDALGLPDWGGRFLALYFLAGAAAMPAWVALSARLGLLRSWLAGMVLSIAAFAWVLMLPGLPPTSALVGFGAVSLLAGLALGADLVAPAALLAGVIQRAGGRLGEGACFGLWNFATKLNLALAAGLALPLLETLGYTPGAASPAGTRALLLAYGLLPCVLKIGAAILLWRQRNHLKED